MTYLMIFAAVEKNTEKRRKFRERRKSALTRENTCERVGRRRQELDIIPG